MKNCYLLHLCYHINFKIKSLAASATIFKTNRFSSQFMTKKCISVDATAQNAKEREENSTFPKTSTNRKAKIRKFKFIFDKKLHFLLKQIENNNNNQHK